MRRKVNFVGKGTLTISLPRWWVKRFSVKKGDELDLLESKNNLVISTSGLALSGWRVSVSVGGLEPRVIRAVVAVAYKCGYDEILVNYEKSEELAAIQEFLGYGVLGFDIVAHGKYSVLIRGITSVDEKEFNTGLQRFFLFVENNLRDGAEAFKRNDKETINKLILRHRVINKYGDFCLRIITKSNAFTINDTIMIDEIIRLVRGVSREYALLCEYILSKNVKFNEKLLSVNNKLVKIFIDFQKLYNNCTFLDIQKYRSNVDDLKNNILALDSKLSKKQSSVLLYLYFIAGVLHSISSALYIKTINLSTEKVGQV